MMLALGCRRGHGQSQGCWVVPGEGDSLVGGDTKTGTPCKLSNRLFPLFLEIVVGWDCLREDGCWGRLWVGPSLLGPNGGSPDPTETLWERGWGEGTSRRGGDAVPAVSGSSESTRSYRRISGVVGKAGSAVPPQSPGGPEDPALSKVPPVPMPRRFAPVGATARGGGLRGVVMWWGGHPLHCQASQLPLSRGGGWRDQGGHNPWGWGWVFTPSPTPLQAKGRQKRVKAVADCKGDKARELTFSKGEVIVVTREEDEQSWVSVNGGPNPGSFPPNPAPFLGGGLGVHWGGRGMDGCPLPRLCVEEGWGGLPLMCHPWLCLSKSLWELGYRPQSCFSPT